MTTKIYEAKIEYDGKYFIAEVPSIKHCYTQAPSLQMLLKRLVEVITLCLEEQAGSKNIAAAKKAQITPFNIKLTLTSIWI